MSVADDLKEVLDKIPDALVPEKAAGVNAIVQLNLSGDGGGDWHMTIANGQVVVDEGQAASPDVSLEMDAADYVDITKGDGNPMTMFMAGKIKVQGNISIAMKFQDLFDKSRVA